MLTVLAATLPIFALIALGAVFGRTRGIGATGVAALNGFTAWLALPALLFRSLAMGTHAAVPAGFLIATIGGTFGLFVLAFFLGLPRGAATADRALAALAASYSNTGFLGLPLLAALLGPIGTLAATVASIETISLLFALAVLIIEIGLHGGGSLGAAWRVAKNLLRNPLISAPLAGAAWAFAGWPLPTLLDRPIGLLAAAASPCALVTIGAFLALPGQRAEPRALFRCLLIKLLAQPALVALLLIAATAIGFGVTRAWSTAAILLAALPTGTGPFMLAELHRREAALASRMILLSTVIGAVTVSLLAAVLLR